jgi:hypothetical protein
MIGLSREVGELREWCEKYATPEIAQTCGAIEYTRTDIAQARIAQLEAALKWYAPHVADCRKLGRNGDVARGKLDRDGGSKARAALKETP